MRKSTIIEHDTFKLITQYDHAVKGKAARNHLKMEMLNSIISIISEKWTRMKPETRSALEYICFLAIERGFAYAGSQHVSERFDIDSSTIRRYLCLLEKEGCIKRIWRSSCKHNGRGKAVIFLTCHPYFEKYWGNMFFFEEETQANTQAEISQTLTQSSENDRLIVCTVSQPNISKRLNKRNQEPLNTSFTSNSVSREFVDFAGNFFHSAFEIEEFWKIIRIQCYWLDYNEREKSLLGIDALRQLIRVIKLGKKEVNNQFGLFYKIVQGILDNEMNELINQGA